MVIGYEHTNDSHGFPALHKTRNEMCLVTLAL
jgi:hypothetical protein